MVRRKSAPKGRKLGAILGEHTPQLRFGDYLKPSLRLPTPPAEFGYGNAVPDWGALGNCEVGDCAVAGPYHAEMLWNAQGKHRFEASTPRVIETYSQITGYVPGDPATDLGSDPHDVALFWRDQGLADDDGNRHTIAAFIDLTPGNLTELWLATWLFSGTGVCLDMPRQWLDASDAADTAIWDAVQDPEIVGGHYVWAVGRQQGSLPVVSWGTVARITPAGYRQANVRTLAYLSHDMLAAGVSVNGFDFDQLRADITELGKAAA